MKLPPIEKIYEAFSAIADGRVNMESQRALVTSSNSEKEYSVCWKDNFYSSNDNATYWQNYPGYPILAVLMLQGVLPYSSSTAAHFKNINWNELNKEFKRDYSKVVEMILQKIENTGIDSKAIKDEVSEIYDKLKTLDLNIVKKINT